MKKNILTSAALLFIAMTAVVFTSCGKDKEEIEQQDPTPAYVKAAFTFHFTKDMLDYCDIIVKYNDGTGEKSEKVTELDWTKTVLAALPANLSFSRVITLKANADLTSVSKVKSTNGYNISYVIQNAKEENLGPFHSDGVNPTTDVPSANYVENVKAKKYDKIHTYSFDKDGNLLK